MKHSTRGLRQRAVFRKVFALFLGVCISLTIVAISAANLVGRERLTQITGFVEEIPLDAPCAPVSFKYGRAAEQWSCNTFTTIDPRVGPKPRPHTATNHKKFYDNKVVFDVRYATDEFGRRKTTSPANETADRFVAFFGCSQVFGFGLEERQTLPDQFAQYFPNTAVYNYGVPGYGPHNMLAKLQTGDLRREIKQRRGVLIFEFIDSHIERAVGAPNCFQNWSHPYYRLGKNLRPVRFKNFLIGRPLTTMTFRVLVESGLLTPFGAELDFIPRKKHYQLVQALFEESMRKFAAQFEVDGFYVLIYPDFNSRVTRKMTSQLERSPVPVLNYLDLFDGESDRLQIPHDGHPNGLANKLIARRLARELGKVNLQTDK